MSFGSKEKNVGEVIKNRQVSLQGSFSCFGVRVGAEKREEEKGEGLHFQQVSVLGCSPYQRHFDLKSSKVSYYSRNNQACPQGFG